jgi:AraC family transcriptional regulator of adaptative response/methylated-DNA-[protein]-cysteine methyltransferase
MMALLAIDYDVRQAAEDYQRVEQALHFLHENFDRQPSLEEMAASAGLSEFHFQRLFSRWVGVSPKRFLQYLTKEYAKKLLESSYDILSAAYAAGLSSPGRLHDLLVVTEAVTPGEYKREGEGLEIDYGFHPTPFGECLLAATERGISGLSFVMESRDQALASMKNRWKRASWSYAPDRTGELARQVFAHLYGSGLPGLTASQEARRPLSVFLRGTNFQIQVWEALLRIPPGTFVSYEAISAQLGRPGAARAVGTALARNPVPWIIPCHRVIRRLGDFGEYQFGAARKQAMLGWEAAHFEASLFDAAHSESARFDTAHF